MKARAGLIGPFAIALLAPLLAQTIPPASIADQEMGWAKIYNFKGATEPLKVDDRVYSPAQRTISEPFRAVSNGTPRWHARARERRATDGPPPWRSSS